MSQTIPSGRSDVPADSPDIMHNPVYQAYQLLHIAFVVAPILAGLDKFFHLLVNWDSIWLRLRRGYWEGMGTSS